MQKVSLEVQPRDLGQTNIKRNNNQLRNDGFVPAVLYGSGAPVLLAVNKKTLQSALQTEAGANAMFNIQLSGKTTLGMIKDIQRDIFTQEPIHVDFFRINVKEKITVNVPVHSVGEAPGVKTEGGILEHIQRDIQIRCLPDVIPPHIDIDISSLKLHQSIKVGDLNLGANIEVLTPADHIIYNIVAPRVEEVAPAPAAAVEGAAQPEVIAKGKKEEEGAEAGKEGKEAKTEAKPEAKEAKAPKK